MKWVGKQILFKGPKVFACMAPFLARRYAPPFRVAWYSLLLVNLSLTFSTWIVCRKGLMKKEYPFRREGMSLKKFITDAFSTVFEMGFLFTVIRLSQVYWPVSIFTQGEIAAARLQYGSIKAAQEALTMDGGVRFLYTAFNFLFAGFGAFGLQ